MGHPNAKKYAKTSYLKRKKEVEAFQRKVGKNCLICKSVIRLVCHKKDFKAHTCFYRYGVKKRNPNDYARLCYPCHYGVHWIHKYLKFAWEEIIKYLS